MHAMQVICKAPGTATASNMPATTPPPTIQWLHQFNVPLSATLKPYIGGLVFHITTSTVSPTVGVGLDAPLYIAALLLFISIIVWKYFG